MTSLHLRSRARRINAWLDRPATGDLVVGAVVVAILVSVAITYLIGELR